MPRQNKIAPCLWFDDEAEEAARYYTGIFDNSRILAITRYGKAGFEVHGQPAGKVLSIAFELDGEPFAALNGGPRFKFNEAISLQIYCETQKEIDYFWEKLGAGGDEKARVCGWLKDKYGVSWQVVPSNMAELMGGGSEKSDRVMTSVLEMKKINLAALERAARS